MIVSRWKDVSIRKGSDFQSRFLVADEKGTSVDITGYTVMIMVSFPFNFDDPTKRVEIPLPVQIPPDATSGVVNVYIPQIAVDDFLSLIPDGLDTLSWRLILVSPSGERHEAFRGNLIIKR